MTAYPPLTHGYRVGESATRWLAQTFAIDGRGSALDVVHYEEAELGNDLQIDLTIRDALATLPASRLIWVCRTAAAAARYQHDPDDAIDCIVFPPDSRVIGYDRDDGVLVLLGAKKA